MEVTEEERCLLACNCMRHSGDPDFASATNRTTPTGDQPSLFFKTRRSGLFDAEIRLLLDLGRLLQIAFSDPIWTSCATKFPQLVAHSQRFCHAGLPLCCDDLFSHSRGVFILSRGHGHADSTMARNTSRSPRLFSQLPHSTLGVDRLKLPCSRS